MKGVKLHLKGRHVELTCVKCGLTIVQPMRDWVPDRCPKCTRPWREAGRAWRH